MCIIDITCEVCYGMRVMVSLANVRDHMTPEVRRRWADMQRALGFDVIEGGRDGQARDRQRERGQRSSEVHARLVGESEGE